MVAWIFWISWSTPSLSSLLSGRMRRRVEGASPTYWSTRSQYSGWVVYWSQATHGPLGQAAVVGQQDVSRGKGGFLHGLVPP